MSRASPRRISRETVQYFLKYNISRTNLLDGHFKACANRVLQARTVQTFEKLVLYYDKYAAVYGPNIIMLKKVLVQLGYHSVPKEGLVQAPTKQNNY